MVTSRDTKKHLTRIQHPFMTKTLNKLGIERNFLNLTKNVQNPTANIIVNGENKVFPC